MTNEKLLKTCRIAIAVVAIGAAIWLFAGLGRRASIPVPGGDVLSENDTTEDEVVIPEPEQAPLPRIEFNDPEVKVTTPAFSEHLGLDDACSKVVAAGRVSLTLTPVACEGPSLLTFSVYVSISPGVTTSGEPSLVMDKSASCGTATSTL